jgi:integrase
MSPMRGDAVPTLSRQRPELINCGQADGADRRNLQSLLGHADIATTPIDMTVLDERLRQVVEEHHPLAAGDA